MKLTLDNNQRVFLIERKGFFTNTYFCNLSHIPEILTNELEKTDDFTIKEFCNASFKKCSKKRLNEMFFGNKIDFKL